MDPMFPRDLSDGNQERPMEVRAVGGDCVYLVGAVTRAYVSTGRVPAGSQRKALEASRSRDAERRGSGAHHRPEGTQTLRRFPWIGSVAVEAA